MSHKTNDELLEDAQKVSSVIATARQLMGDGKMVDLSNLEGKIQTLCEDAENAQQDHSLDVQEALMAIVEDLNLLNEEMSAKLWADDEQSAEENAKRALNAYSQDGEES